mmetsp:Transcript_20866/g.31977  ORF Transcript_20866/g.31977 Transcript_20866/m.31977 type:complete len:274 (+) Transcript_20866:1054-1875(+)
MMRSWLVGIILCKNSSGFSEFLEGNVKIRKAKKYGEDALGVFALEEIKKDTYLGEYGGELLDLEKLLERHPSGEPEYAFRVSDTHYLDAENVDFWTKRMNHAYGQEANIRFDIVDEKRVLFYASTDISKDEELCFDYGQEFWEGRTGDPPLNDDRNFSITLQQNNPIPISNSALVDVLTSRDLSFPQKRASIMRALEYFGISIDDDIPLPHRFFFFLRSFRDRTRRKTSPQPSSIYPIIHEDASLKQLARALRYQFYLADRIPLDEEEDYSDY